MSETKFKSSLACLVEEISRQPGTGYFTWLLVITCMQVYSEKIANGEENQSKMYYLERERALKRLMLQPRLALEERGQLLRLVF